MLAASRSSRSISAPLAIPCPRRAPDRLSCQLALQVIAQQFGQIGGQGLDAKYARLVAACGQRDGRRIAVQGEALWGEAGQGAGPEAAAKRSRVQREPIHAGQAAERALA